MKSRKVTKNRQHGTKCQVCVCCPVRILTAESHHLSSFPTWQTVSLVKLRLNSVALVGESATPQKKVPSDSFLSDLLAIPAADTVRSRQTVPVTSHQPVMRTAWFASFTGGFIQDTKPFRCCFILRTPEQALQMFPALIQLLELLQLGCSVQRRRLELLRTFSAQKVNNRKPERGQNVDKP